MANSADPVQLAQKPTDLNLHCLQWQDISGFSRTWVKQNQTWEQSHRERRTHKLPVLERLLVKTTEDYIDFAGLKSKNTQCNPTLNSGLLIMSAPNPNYVTNNFHFWIFEYTPHQISRTHCTHVETYNELKSCHKLLAALQW